MYTYLRLKQGDADTFTEVIENLATLTGYTAKLYIYDPDGTLSLVITGTIENLTITYELGNDDSQVFVLGRGSFESKIFDADDHVYTSSWGPFMVTPADDINPS